MADDATSLIPTEVKTVDFYGDTIVGALVRVDNIDTIYVPTKPLCDYLGVDWSAQRQRILRDPVLAEGMVVITMPSARGQQATSCLPLDLIPGFLFGISTGRVTKPDVQEKLNRYRRECFRILWEAFRPEIIRADDVVPTPGMSGAQVAYEIATAVQHLARQQLDLEQRLNAAGRWAKGMEDRVDQVEDRVAVLELSLGPRSPIDEEQAASLAAAVRAVGWALEQRGTGDYRGVYGQLYARFGITSYKNLPREKYEQARTWLEAWHREITGQTPPQSDPEVS